MIGASTQINENAEIVASVIGCNCSIGTGTIIRDSYIFDGSTIGSDCVIERSIIGAGVTIKDNSVVHRGSLVGDGVIVGPSALLRPFERLSRKRDSTDSSEDEDSDLEDVEASQDSPNTLGKDSNAIIWPAGPPDDAEEDDITTFQNERFMRLGDNASDLDISDDGSESSSCGSDSGDISDSDTDSGSLSAFNDISSSLKLPGGTPMVESEFQTEVKQSLERAFTEGHSIDNAAVELKTLRMASNVPLTRVREAVVGAIVEKIRIVDDGPVAQRKEISAVVSRWGGLIDKIGGIDPIETVSALQVRVVEYGEGFLTHFDIFQSHCATSKRLPLFGQILAALYQDDIVDEDDIRKWHRLPTAQGEGVKANDDVLENLKKCWNIGAHMIKQFDEQESDEDSDEDADEEEDDDDDDDDDAVDMASTTKREVSGNDVSINAPTRQKGVDVGQSTSAGKTFGKGDDVVATSSELSSKGSATADEESEEEESEESAEESELGR
ncbi:hypothetical protein C0993_011508 [Termitomyces sp. T159_Od127]|nr:hypothetical protein C0993_011508 [Termitomyces sp. T159_Od127]